MSRYAAPLPPMSPTSIIGQLQVANNRKSQARIIKEAWQSNSEEFFIGVELATNSTNDFKLKTVPEIQDIDDGSPGELSFREFYSLAMQLIKTNMTDDAVKEAITNAAMRANVTEWNMWYRRILLKTLPNYLPMDVIKDTLSALTSV